MVKNNPHKDNPQPIQLMIRSSIGLYSVWDTSRRMQKFVKWLHSQITSVFVSATFLHPCCDQLSTNGGKCVKKVEIKNYLLILNVTDGVKSSNPLSLIIIILEKAFWRYLISERNLSTSLSSTLEIVFVNGRSFLIVMLKS